MDWLVFPLVGMVMAGWRGFAALPVPGRAAVGVGGQVQAGSESAQVGTAAAVAAVEAGQFLQPGGQVHR